MANVKLSRCFSRGFPATAGGACPLQAAGPGKRIGVNKSTIQGYGAGGAFAIMG